MELLKQGMPREETKRYVQNYMSVVDLRPVTEEDLVKHEDELYSDEELDPKIVDAATRRKTRVGGTPMEKEDRQTNTGAEGEKEKSREAMARGDAAWGEGARQQPARTAHAHGLRGHPVTWGASRSPAPPSVGGPNAWRAPRRPRAAVQRKDARRPGARRASGGKPGSRFGGGEQ